MARNYLATLSPFSYFGSKASCAPLVWQRLGNVDIYVEPFAGSLGNLLRRPFKPKVEIINDIDGFVVNFWRCAKYDPSKLVDHLDFPMNENELFARHAWLMHDGRKRIKEVQKNPKYFDHEVAGHWAYGIGANLGRVWCSEKDTPRLNLGRAGIDLPCKNRKTIAAYFDQLTLRLRLVECFCGDWKRVVNRFALRRAVVSGVFLDPPYLAANRQDGLYRKDDTDVARDVETWCLANGGDSSLRIVLAGYEGHYKRLSHWDAIKWKKHPGLGTLQSKGVNRTNPKLETLWFSPSCLSGRKFERLL